MTASATSRDPAIDVLATALGLAPTDEDVVRLSERASRTTYADGARVYSRGGPASRLMCVLRGRVQIRSIGPSGQQHVMGVLGPGGSLGVIAALDGGPDGLEAFASGTTEILSVSRADLIARLERSAEARRTIALEICRRSRVVTSLIANLSLREAGARLLGHLLILAEACGRTDPTSGALRIHHGLSQEALADGAGLTRVSVNRQLASWREQGLVETGRGLVMIPDPEALDAFVWSQ